VETRKESKILMFQFSRFLRRDWEGFGLLFLFLVKLLGLLIVFLLLGCSTPLVEVGKVTIVIKEPIRSAHKGEQ